MTCLLCYLLRKCLYSLLTIGTREILYLWEGLKIYPGQKLWEWVLVFLFVCFETRSQNVALVWLALVYKPGWP